MTTKTKATAIAEERRDPDLPGRLLAAERDVLVPLLRSRPDGDFALPVAACPGRTVRDVLAHCSAVLTRLAERLPAEGALSPESDDRDIAERSGWPHTRIVDELERGMTEAGPVIARAGGGLDGLALGEWVHAGDVREAFGAPGAYAGPGLADALLLLTRVSRDQGGVPLHADLYDFDEPLRLGAASGERTPARFLGDATTLVRLYAGRSPGGAAYELAGAAEGELNLYG
jgi:uncharacterized protein (TIGR03083 family)